MKAGARTRTALLQSDRGSAVAEFALITGLVILLVIGLIQLAVFLHWRNMAADAASHGARYGAFPDQDAQTGAQRAQQILDDSLTTGAGKTQGEVVQASYGQSIKVTVTVHVPILGIVPGPLTYQTSTQAARISS